MRHLSRETVFSYSLVLREMEAIKIYIWAYYVLFLIKNI